MRTLLPLLFASLMIVPVASAEPTANILLKMDSPSEFVMEATASITGDEAAQMRAGMDQFGDGDGQVEASEVQAMEDFFLSFMDRAGDDGESSATTIGSSFTIDGKGPKSFDFQEFDIRDAEGPVSSTGALTAFLKAHALFDVQAADKHTIRLVADEDAQQHDEEEEDGNDFFDAIESAKFRAAPGYIFSEVSGLPEGAKVSGDKKEIDFKDALAPPAGEAVIVMSKGGGGGGVAPGAGIGVLVAAWVAVALVARRR